MADTRSYTGIDSAAFTCVKEKLGELGLVVPDGDSGDIAVNRGGIQFTIQFTWSSPVLDLSVTDRPSYVPADKIWGMTDECAKLCGGTVA